MKTLEQILEICCNSFGVTPNQVISETKIPPVAAARAAYVYHGDAHTDGSITKETVMKFIKRNRTTFIFLNRAYKNRLETELWLTPINDQIEYQIITN